MIAHNLEILEVFCHSDFTWNQSLKFRNLKNCNFDYFLFADFFILGKFGNFSEPKFPKSKIQSLWNCKNDKFPDVRFAKTDFTQNLCGKKILKVRHCGVFIWMTLFSRKDIGFGKTVVSLLVIQIGVLDNRTISMEMQIVCISTKILRNGMIPNVMVPSYWNLCVKSMLEINQQDFFVIHFQCCATCWWIKFNLPCIQFQTLKYSFMFICTWIWVRLCQVISELISCLQ